MDILAHWPLQFPKETLSLGRAHNIILLVIGRLLEEGRARREIRMTEEEGGRDGKDVVRGLRRKEQRNDGKDTKGQGRRTGRGQMGGGGVTAKKKVLAHSLGFWRSTGLTKGNNEPRQGAMVSASEATQRDDLSRPPTPTILQLWAASPRAWTLTQPWQAAPCGLWLGASGSRLGSRSIGCSS